MRQPALKALAAAALVAAAGGATAQSRGSGSTWQSWRAPPTRGAGLEASRATTRSQVPGEDRRRGMLGAPGAGQDHLGDSRLGARVEPLAVAPEGSWVAGDRVRSGSAADVRSARQQANPDRETAGASAGR